MRAAGVDVWKGRWVAVVLNRGAFETAFAEDSFDRVLGALGDTDAIGVDIPIGLPRAGQRRAAEQCARDFLRPGRGSSVFPVYPRVVYEAEDRAAASTLSVGLGHGGVTSQAYALGARLLEVDAAVRGSSSVVREVHPEVSFRAMAGAPPRFGKRSWNGMNERLALLAAHRIELPRAIEAIGSAGVDDLLDAAAVAWSATRIARDEAMSLPSPPQRIDDRQVAIWC